MLRRHCGRLRRRWLCCGALFIVIVTFAYWLDYQLTELVCNNADSVDTLKQLCDRYHKDLAVGNLCPHLCDYQTIWYDSCTNFREGKQAFKAQWMGETIMLKAKKRLFEDSEIIKHPMTYDDYVAMVADSVRFNFPRYPEEESNLEIFTKLWFDDVDKYIYYSSEASSGRVKKWHKKALDSLWSVVQQDEYLLSRAYSSSPYLPKILGSCGHFYAVDFSPSGNLLAPGGLEYAGLIRHSWKKRATVALGLLRVLKSFEDDFDETLHMCDLKGDNFGITADGMVKAIDVDMAVFHTKLLSDLSFPNCTRHKDCDFFDCQGWCDATKGKCTKIRVNNNLQVLCQKILVSTVYSGYFGLLDGAPSREISALLQRCLHPAAPTDPLPGCSMDGDSIVCRKLEGRFPQYSADYAIYDQLKQLLESSIQ